ncbi:hypothetical protein N0V84_001797 [Fusarium piperis]|uniref:Uncharacterized protein n=1 Tax=Fusarium piperis TaxID=1435070 RepID=A0A9W8WKK3_9HYPO|nr:hypothetical protein N0V84_001797 [Fusarium piperis]
MASDQVSECECCFTECALDHLIHCNGEQAHCMSTEGCSAGFSVSERAKFLSADHARALDCIEKEAVLRMADIENLEKCPFCPYAEIYPPVDIVQEFRCQGPDCGKASCRLCNLEAHLPMSCEEATRQKATDLRHTVEEAMSEALIRRCNKWGKCVQFDSVEDRHREEVDKAGKAATDTLLKANPHLKPESLALNMSTKVEKDDLKRKQRDPFVNQDLLYIDGVRVNGQVQADRDRAQYQEQQNRRQQWRAAMIDLTLGIGQDRLSRRQWEQIRGDFEQDPRAMVERVDPRYLPMQDRGVAPRNMLAALNAVNRPQITNRELQQRHPMVQNHRQQQPGQGDIFQQLGLVNDSSQVLRQPQNPTMDNTNHYQQQATRALDTNNQFGAGLNNHLGTYQAQGPFGTRPNTRQQVPQLQVNHGQSGAPQLNQVGRAQARNRAWAGGPNTQRQTPYAQGQNEVLEFNRLGQPLRWVSVRLNTESHSLQAQPNQNRNRASHSNSYGVAQGHNQLDAGPNIQQQVLRLQLDQGQSEAGENPNPFGAGFNMGQDPQ